MTLVPFSGLSAHFSAQSGNDRAHHPPSEITFSGLLDPPDRAVERAMVASPDASLAEAPAASAHRFDAYGMFGRSNALISVDQRPDRAASAEPETLSEASPSDRIDGTPAMTEVASMPPAASANAMLENQYAAPPAIRSSGAEASNQISMAFAMPTHEVLASDAEIVHPETNVRMAGIVQPTPRRLALALSFREVDGALEIVARTGLDDIDDVEAIRREAERIVAEHGLCLSSLCLDGRPIELSRLTGVSYGR